jgi:D-serine deaminase-like pyridoxal phosphate-dependent protein
VDTTAQPAVSHRVGADKATVATIELESPSEAPRVGARLESVVGYSDTTVHLHEEIYATRNGRIEAVWPILGRGKIR